NHQMQQPQPWKIMDISPQSKTINDWLAQSSTSTSSATRMISREYLCFPPTLPLEAPCAQRATED
ncbi:MAG: hypothetical protein ABSD13_10215, partial [Candidatus Korobacteraceae bacterium]